MRLEFILFCGTLSHIWLYMVLEAQKAKFKLVCLNKLVTLCISGLSYVKVTQFSFIVFMLVWLLFAVL